MDLQKDINPTNEASDKDITLLFGSENDAQGGTIQALGHEIALPIGSDALREVQASVVNEMALPFGSDPEALRQVALTAVIPAVKELPIPLGAAADLLGGIQVYM